MNSLNNTVTSSKHSMQLMSRWVIRAGLLFLALLMFSSFNKVDSSKNARSGAHRATAALKLNTIQYTITKEHDTMTTTEGLTDDSYCMLGKESTISISDNNGKFHIGLLHKGAFGNNEVHALGNGPVGTNSNYSVAAYTTTHQDNTVSAACFQQGGATVVRVDRKNRFVKISFQYTMRQPQTAEPVTLKGTAIVRIIN